MKDEEKKTMVTVVPQSKGNTGASPSRGKGNAGASPSRVKGIVGASPSKGATMTAVKILPGKTVAKPSVNTVAKPPVKPVAKKESV